MAHQSRNTMPFEDIQQAGSNNETIVVEENVAITNPHPQDILDVEFYARALIIYSHFQQQQEDRLHSRYFESATRPGRSSSDLSHKQANTKPKYDGPRQTDATSDVRAFVNAWALLLSRSRNGPKQVTAAALRRTSNKYTLFIAKNYDPSQYDRKMINTICAWMNSRSQQDGLNPETEDVWKDILIYAKKRIRYYLGFIRRSKSIKCHDDLKFSNRWNNAGKDRRSVTFLSDLCSLLDEIGRGDHSSSNFYNEIMLKCHKFVMDNAGIIREAEELLKEFLGDSCDPCLAWKPLRFVITGIEKLAKMRKAFDDLIKFRKLHITDKAQLEVIHIEPCRESDLQYRPCMSNIRARIGELAGGNAYQHIRDKLYRVAENIQADQDPRMIVHCEIQILNYILCEKNQIRLQEMYDFIGCSKTPCFLCAGTIHLGTSFNVADPHWKLYWKWGIPRSLMRHSDIAHAIASLRYKMDDILQDQKHRPSEESVLNKSPGEDGCNNDWIWNPDLASESPVMSYPVVD
ncbi:hypothetical protein F5Y13DRAFT_185897 [Hypoxylon sp. FL1857]|nr:hypothetical protein F5Y13DRAFT_185897 [Hypoxylon sp. FL1857]